MYSIWDAADLMSVPFFVIRLYYVPDEKRSKLSKRLTTGLRPKCQLNIRGESRSLNRLVTLFPVCHINQADDFTTIK
jgi:hypothetical protein